MSSESSKVVRVLDESPDDTDILEEVETESLPPPLPSNRCRGLFRCSSSIRAAPGRCSMKSS